MFNCRYLLYGLIALIISGCGQTVKESVKIHPTNKSTAGADKTVIVLPFADYSYADDIASAYRRNMYIAENITDQLVSNSFHVSIQEDVFKFLASQNIINMTAYEGGVNSQVKSELKGDWSPEMKNLLQHYMDANANRSNPGQTVSDSPGTHGLTQQEIIKIGRHFNADYIIRGRIVEYKTRQDPSWDPMKRGWLTFITGSSSKLTFGNASTDKYDMYGNMVSGAFWGGLLGSGLSWPWDPSKANQTILGVSGGRGANTILWMGLGSQMGKMAHESGVPQAVVQLRMWVQDAYTGDVVWTNRVDVKVSPETVLADSQYDVLFESATEKAISTLIDSFVAKEM